MSVKLILNGKNIKSGGVYDWVLKKVANIASVKKIQAKRGLNNDGIIGPVTFTALLPQKVELGIFFDSRKIEIKVKDNNGIPALKNLIIFSCSAKAGLPLTHNDHPSNRERSKKGADPSNNIDYTRVCTIGGEYNYSVVNTGLLPPGTYKLKTTKDMKSEGNAGNGGAWGRGGWRLIGSYEKRGGFYLHEDGGQGGTHGCIGISKTAKDNFGTIKKILQQYCLNRSKASRLISVKVQYISC